MKIQLTETKYVDAHFYLDEYGDEIKCKNSFVKYLATEMFAGYMGGYMIYLGGGYDPLRIAIIARDEENAYEIMEEWCRNTDRLEEINQHINENDEEWGNYESFIQWLPEPVAVVAERFNDMVVALRTIRDKTEGFNTHYTAKTALGEYNE